MAERLGLDDGPGLAGHVARYGLALPYAVGADVLDAACGTGYGTRLLRVVARSVVGLDVSTSVEAGPPSVAGDVRALPFADASFDLLTAFEIIEHVLDQDRLVTELRRVLRPGGVLLLSTPHGEVERLHDRQRGQSNEFHIASVTPGQLRSLLRPHFASVTLLGQADSGGLAHDLVRGLDRPHLHLRVGRRQAAPQPAGHVGPGPGDGGASPLARRPRPVFSQLGVGTSPSTIAVCGT